MSLLSLLCNFEAHFYFKASPCVLRHHCVNLLLIGDQYQQALTFVISVNAPSVPVSESCP